MLQLDSKGMKSKEMLFPKKKKTNVVGSKCMEFIVMLFSKERKPMCYGWFHVKETQRNVFFLNKENQCDHFQVY